jgi:hypothetical protein
VLSIRPIHLTAAALAFGAFVASHTQAQSLSVSENFAVDPALHGWKIFGDSSLFAWDSANQNLAVTWNSAQTNSFFYYPLGTSLTRRDDFSIEFDMVLKDVASGSESGKTGSMQMGLGFLNSAQATNTTWMRGSWGDAPNVAEFDYYAPGYYDFDGFIYNSAATASPSFISGVNSTAYAPTILSVYKLEFPTLVPIHVRMDYSGLTQTATLAITTNGVAVTTLPQLPLDASHGLTATDDFHVDMFSVSSYSSQGDYYDSVLAHGTLSSLKFSAQVRPVATIAGALDGSGHWQASFFSRTNWNYTLERTSDFASWKAVDGPAAGTGANLSLQDTDLPSGAAFYRVRANAQ